MKSLIKFFPVAVGVLALASCSNDDFLGSSNEDGKLELVATVAAPAGSDDGLSTRSVITPAENVADYQSNWQPGDVFRVYDAALQKYDAFSYKSGKVTIDTDPAKVTEYAKAIFPGESVSYAGWSAKNDAVTATVLINPTITYEPAVKVGEKTAYVSNLPMWGDATMEDDHLAVNLNPLTAYTDITVYGGATAAKYIRVISTNSTNATSDAAVAWGYESNIVGNPSAGIQQTPLTGYFDAMLVDGGQMVANLTAPLADKYGCYIKVDLTGVTADESHIILPIVAQKYDVLIIQYSTDGTTWTELKKYTSTTVANNIVIRKDLEIGTAIETQDAKVSAFADINARLTTFNNGSYTGVKVINIDLADGVAADAIKTSDGKQTITIPDFAEEKIINLNFDIDDTGYNLTIDNDNSAATVLNLKTIKGNMPVTIQQGSNNFTITGEINSTGTGENKRLIVGETGNLILGLDDFGPFKTDMNLYLTANVYDLTIAAGEGNTIAAIDASAASNASTINVASGTVTAIGGTTAAATLVNIGGGTVTTLKNTAAAINVTAGNVGTISASGNSAITISGGTVGTATTKAATVTINGGTVTKVTNGNAAVTIGTDAAVSEVTTATTSTVAINSALTKLTMTGAGTLNITDATVDEVNVNVTGATINLAGTTKLAQITSLKTNKPSGIAAAVVSTNEAAILAVSADDRFTFNASTASTWNGKKAPIGDSGNIYTTAQLASVTTGKAYKLMATSYDVSGATWTPVNISKNFAGNSKTILGLTTPLFGTISGGTVNKLTLISPSISSDKADQGALAQIATGTVTIEEITVTGATIGAGTGTADSKNIGGLIGRANGTLTFNKNKLTGATIQGYANVGGYIGNLEGGTVTIKSGASNTTYQSSIFFVKTFIASALTDMNEGTFGNFIGSITGANANVTIGGSGTNGADIAKFFEVSSYGVNASGVSANWTKNTNEDATKTYVGMKNAISLRQVNYEIGYSPVSALGTVILYGNITDELGNPIAVTIDHINQYE